MRSLYLDHLTPAQVSVLTSVGNTAFNTGRETAELRAVKPRPGDTEAVKTSYVWRKYKEFYDNSLK